MVHVPVQVVSLLLSFASKTPRGCNLRLDTVIIVHDFVSSDLSSSFPPLPRLREEPTIIVDTIVVRVPVQVVSLLLSSASKRLPEELTYDWTPSL